MHLPNNPTIILLSIYPREIATVFVVAPDEPIQMLLSGEWWNKMWCIHTMKCSSTVKRNELFIYTTTWMNFKRIMLIESTSSLLSQKIKLRIKYDPIVLLLDMYPKELKAGS